VIFPRCTDHHDIEWRAWNGNLMDDLHLCTVDGIAKLFGSAERELGLG
jgi:hypothetical protein